MTSEPAETTSTKTVAASALIAPWWHTALMVLLIVGLSIAGAQQVRTLGDKPLHLVAGYCRSIVYEWVLAALALWGIHLRKVPLRRLLGESRPGVRAWIGDLAAALLYWIVALSVLAGLSQFLTKVSGSHIDPRKIADVTQKLAPGTTLEITLFLLLSLSAGFCEELVFRGYLQQQFTRISHRVWAGIALSAVVFGCAHGYEGLAGILLIAAYGAMFGVLAHLRRGLRTGMIAHAWHDSVSGLALLLMRHYGFHLSGK